MCNDVTNKGRWCLCSEVTNTGRWFLCNEDFYDCWHGHMKSWRFGEGIISWVRSLQLTVLWVEPVEKYRHSLCFSSGKQNTTKTGFPVKRITAVVILGSSLSDSGWCMACEEKFNLSDVQISSASYVQGLWSFKNCHSRTTIITFTREVSELLSRIQQDIQDWSTLGQHFCILVCLYKSMSVYLCCCIIFVKLTIFLWLLCCSLIFCIFCNLSFKS